MSENWRNLNILHLNIFTSKSLRGQYFFIFKLEYVFEENQL